MSSTYFETEGSSSGRQLYIQLLYNLFTPIIISSLVGKNIEHSLLKLQNSKSTVKTQLYFISYEWVDHIAAYSYMFRPLSAIVKLYYFLL